MYTEECLDMTNEANRLTTFVNWPVAFITPLQMAENGFYYMGVNDEVRCAYCKVELGRWTEDNVPAVDHRRWAPQCPFLNKLDAGRDVCGTGNVICSGTPVHPRYATEIARLRTFEHTWPRALKQKPEQLADAGFFYTGLGDMTKCFYCDGGLKDWEDDDDPWQQHARWFDRCPYVHLVKGRDYVQQIVKEARLNHKNDERVGQMEKIETTHEIDEEKVCKMCYDAEKTVCFVPCGHVVTCGKCAATLKTCPTCRVEIQNAVRMYQV